MAKLAITANKTSLIFAYCLSISAKNESKTANIVTARLQTESFGVDRI